MLNARNTGSQRQPTRSRFGDVYPSPSQAHAGAFCLFVDAGGIGGGLERLPYGLLQSTGDLRQDP